MGYVVRTHARWPSQHPGPHATVPHPRDTWPKFVAIGVHTLSRPDSVVMLSRQEVPQVSINLRELPDLTDQLTNLFGVEPNTTETVIALP